MDGRAWFMSKKRAVLKDQISALTNFSTFKNKKYEKSQIYFRD